MTANGIECTVPRIPLSPESKRLFSREEASKRMRKVCMSLVFLGVVGCAAVRPNVMVSPNNNLLVTTYHSDRSRAVIGARREARRYCWDFENHQKARVLSESTAYQGRFDEQLTQNAKVAGRVGGILGSPEVAQAGYLLSSPFDYTTTIEFKCEE